MTRRLSKYSFLVAVCVMVLPGLLPAHAEGDATNARFLMPIVQIVEDMAQEGDESRHDFLARVATRMMAFTEFSGFEVSARLCQDSAGMQATKLLTWRAHFSAPAMQVCPLSHPYPIPGFIHTHPPGGTYELTPADVALFNRHRRFFRARPGASRRLSDAQSAGFSATDIELGPGYLVTGWRVLYQSGPGSSHVIRELSVPAVDDPVRTFSPSWRLPEIPD